MKEYTVFVNSGSPGVFERQYVYVPDGLGVADEPMRIAEACRKRFGGGSLQWRNEQWMYTPDSARVGPPGG